MNERSFSFRCRSCGTIEKSAIKAVMPVKTGIQTPSRRKPGTSYR